MIRSYKANKFKMPGTIWHQGFELSCEFQKKYTIVYSNQHKVECNVYELREQQVL